MRDEKSDFTLGGNSYYQQYSGYQPNNMGLIPNLKRTSDTLAIVSLIVGIVAMIGFCCLGGFLGITGIILGIIALADGLCNKRALAIIGIVLSSFALIFTIGVLIFGDTDDKVSTNKSDKIEASTDNTQSTDNSNDNTSIENNSETNTIIDNTDVYHIGDTIYVSTDNGDYELTITGVTETSDRNPYSDTEADRVIIMDYNFKNISYSVEYGDYHNNELSISEMNFTMYDADGNALDTYPATTDYAKAVSPGHKSSGQMAYALNCDKNYIEAEYSDNMFMGSDLTIILEWQN